MASIRFRSRSIRARIRSQNFHPKTAADGNKSKIGENHRFSSPPPAHSSFAHGEGRNGTVASVGAHCVQITTNHLFLWIVPRSFHPPLPSLTVPSDFVLLLGRGREEGALPHLGHSACSLRFIAGQRSASASFDLSFARRLPLPRGR